VDNHGSSEALTGVARENLDLVRAFNAQQDAEVTSVRAAIERISAFFGSPAYFAFVIGFVVLWVGVNTWGDHAGWRHVDAPPFFWLQGIVSSNALLLTVAVLIRQNRMAELAEHRAHLDLQINLLTEQKVTRILQRMNRSPEDAGMYSQTDDESHELSTPADPEALLKAIKRSSDDRD
jgi:uncharacterized membrane protein